MLLKFLNEELIEAGCDEAGRGPLAGPVFAAAVILPKDFENEILNDSKLLTLLQREELREIIKKNAIAYGVAYVDNKTIDKINILNASFLAMHKAIDKLKIQPDKLLIDGNRFNKYKDIPHNCIIKGDGKYTSIAAASVLAKTYRDDFMKKIHKEFPQYEWNENKGYPTKAHREAIIKFGPTKYHRMSYNLIERQLSLEL